MKISSLLLYALGLLLILFFLAGIVRSQTAGEVLGKPWAGAPGVTKTTQQIMEAQQASPRPAGRLRMSVEHEVDRSGLKQNPGSPEVSLWPPSLPSRQPERQTAVPLAPQTLGTSFTGATLADAGAFPPDCMGAVGPTQFIVAINGRIRSFNKSTGVADGILNADMDVFFTSVMTPISNTFTSDPHIRYDRLSGRWIVIIIDVPGGTGSTANRVLIAVSNTSTITGSTVWTFFYFRHDTVSPAGDVNGFADYPTPGIDANAIYIGVNVFDSAGSYSGTTAFVVRKSSVLGAGPIVVTAFRNLTGGPTGSGPFSPQGVDNSDSSATQGYIIGVDNALYGLLQIRRVSNPGGTPSISGNISLTIPSTTSPLNVDHLGNTGGANGKLDGLGLADRLMAAVMRNGHIWTTHASGVNSAGTSSSPTRDGVRWYDIANVSTTPTLNQSGTIFDATSGVRNYWIPTIMVSGQGHAAVGVSTAGTNYRIDGATVGRLSGDALGTMQGTPVLFTASSSAYNPSADPGGPAGRRWGDYSFTSVDPNDDMTMWTIQQYCDATNSWGVRAVKLIAPPPAAPSSASPSSVAAGSSNVNVTITGTSSGGSGFFDPGASFPNRISASVNGGGITVNSVTYTDPTHVTLNITLSPSALNGARTVTVTDPDNQSATSASGILTVTGSTCPSITLSPSTLPGGSAGIPYNQTIAASGGVSPYTFTLTSGALPVGLTLSSGGALSGSQPHGGVFNFTVQATDHNGCTGTLAYALTITCPTITLSPPTLPGGTVGSAYDQTVSASGGTGPYAFSVTSGSLPAGLSLSAGGILSGTPTTSLTYNFTVSARDADSCSGSLGYSVTIQPAPPPTVSLIDLGLAYAQDFNSLGNSGTPGMSTLPRGWVLSESGANADTTYGTGTGSSTTGNTYSFGSAASTERAFGGLQSGNLVPTIGAAFTNNTGSTVTALSLSYTGEQWRLGTAGRHDSLLFQLSLDATSLTTGTWTSYPPLNFAGPVSTGSTGALDGNSSANRTAISSTITGLSIPNGSVFYIRWNDFNATGGDDGLAVDDFSITPFAAPPPTNPTASGQARPDSVISGEPTLLTVSVTPGANPASSGIAVTVNLSSVGGSAAQNFFDDGSHGDSAAGDNRFSFRDTVIAAPGLKSLSVSAADSQGRNASASITLVVKPTPTNPTASGNAHPSTVAPGVPTLLRVAVTPGTNPASTGITVSGNLSAIGGSASQTFFDDGSHGDSASGDNVFSFRDTVDLSTPAGGKLLPVAVSDAQGRSGSDSIALTVTGPCPAISLGPDTLPRGLATVAYDQAITASGGTGPYSFEIAAGTLPQGLSLSASGVLAGIPAVPETASFTVRATDDVGCKGSRLDTLIIGPSPTITAKIPVASRWNLVSNPVTVTNDSVSALFPSRASSAFGYSLGSYQIATKFRHGFGYWLKFGAPETAMITGNTRISDTADVQTGWNILGSISQKIPVASISGIGTSLRSRLFGYAGGYVQADTILPGFGYWAKFDSSGKCVIRTGPSQSISTKPSGADESSLTRLTVTDAGGYSQTLFIGVSEKDDDLQIFELPPTPPPGIPDVRFATERSVDLLPNDFTGNARLLMNSLAYPVELRWASVEIPDIQYTVRGPSLLRKVLAGEGSLVIGDRSVTSLILEARDRSRLPKNFELYQNYPNPFNPTTTIRFDVPRKSAVSLIVYNTLGEKVATLLENVTVDEGEQSVKLNSEKLSSGVYFYRLTAGEFTRVRKMLLIH